MSNYCSNCGKAVEEESTVCPECGEKYIFIKVKTRRKLVLNRITIFNFIWSLFIGLTLILITASFGGITVGYNDWLNDFYTTVESTMFIIGMISLFSLTIMAFVFSYFNYKEFEGNKSTDNQWLFSIFLLIISILLWLPYIIVWAESNW